MQKLSEKKFHITNTPFKRFAPLVAKVVEGGHLETERLKDSLVVSGSKYASELMKTPLSDEEKASEKKTLYTPTGIQSNRGPQMGVPRPHPVTGSAACQHQCPPSRVGSELPLPFMLTCTLQIVC